MELPDLSILVQFVCELTRVALEDHFAMGTSNCRKGGIFRYIEDFVRRSGERVEFRHSYLLDE